MQLESEITRIATQTQFNKMNLLNGSYKSKQIQVGANDEQTISISITTMTAKKLGVDKIHSAVRKAKGSDIGKQLTKIDEAITAVSEKRSDLGAISNRLDHTIANADNMAENLQSSESKIRDVNMASEMVAYSSMSILQQAGQSMLSHANQATQGVLSLLQ